MYIVSIVCVLFLMIEYFVNRVLIIPFDLYNFAVEYINVIYVPRET